MCCYSLTMKRRETKENCLLAMNYTGTNYLDLTKFGIHARVAPFGQRLKHFSAQAQPHWVPLLQELLLKWKQNDVRLRSCCTAVQGRSSSRAVHVYQPGTKTKERADGLKERRRKRADKWMNQWWRGEEMEGKIKGRTHGLKVEARVRRKEETFTSGDSQQGINSGLLARHDPA